MYVSRIKKGRADVSKYLEEGKDEKARLTVEELINMQNMCTCMDTITLMCQLLITRINLIESQPKCSFDLVESVSSIIYASQRMDISELVDIAHQFGLK